MIIACPDCSGPFELEDAHIAALVQVACPNCSFKMILDFAAANDPSLVEAGMKMASGFRSAADYRAASGSPAVERAAEPSLRPVPEPEEARPAARAAQPSAPPIDHIPTEGVEPAPPRAASTSSPARPRVATAPRPPGRPAAPMDDGRRGDTKVGPLPGPPIPAPAPAPAARAAADVPDYDYDDEAPTQIHGMDALSRQAAELPSPPVGRPPAATVPESASETVPAPSRVDPGVPAPIDDAPPEPAPAPAPEPVARPEPASFDPAPASSSPGVAARPAVELPARRAASFGRDVVPNDFGDGGADLDEDFEFRKGSPLGTAIVALLLIAALGLVGASIALKNTPDPRPLLEDLYRQYVR